MNEAPRFPLFISLEGKDALVVGGGTVAARRARILLEFSVKITVISPEISEDMREMLGRITWRQERYVGLDKPYILAIAATNERDVNRKIGEDARAEGIPVSVADSKKESTFWFPAVMRGKGLVMGMVSENGDHSAVKTAAEVIRRGLDSSSLEK